MLVNSVRVGKRRFRTACPNITAILDFCSDQILVMMKHDRNIYAHSGKIRATDPYSIIFPVVMDCLYDFHMRDGIKLNTIQFTEPVYNYKRLTKLKKNYAC